MQPPQFQPPYPHPQQPAPKPMGCLIKGIMWVVGIHAAICFTGAVIGVLTRNEPYNPPGPMPVIPVAPAAPRPSPAPAPAPSPARIDAGTVATARVMDAGIASAPADVPPTAAHLAAMTAWEHLDAGPGEAGIVAFADQLTADERALAALHLAHHDPDAREVHAARRAIVARRRADRREVEAAFEQELRATLCGTTPPELTQMRHRLVGGPEYLAAISHYPDDEHEVVDCSPPVLTRDHCWVTRCTVIVETRSGRAAEPMSFAVGAGQRILGIVRER